MASARLANVCRVAKLRLLAGVGSTLPMQISAINRGYHEPINPASCYLCGLVGPCAHDLVERESGRRFKHSKAIADAGHKAVDIVEIVNGD